MTETSRTRLNSYVEKTLNGSAIFGWLVIVIMMLWITSEVIANLLNMSIPGTYSWAEVLNVIAISIPLAYVTSQGAHIVITLLTARLTGRGKIWAEIISLICVVIFTGFLSWVLSIQAWRSLRAWEFEMGLIKVFWFPSKIALALGFIGSTLVTIFQLVAALRNVIKMPGEDINSEKNGK
jgi:TRAP-type C4-dicarboxylate transport system permease small subunit